MVAVIAVVLTLLLVVGVHEAGHALVARWFKVKIQHIAIGFGKPLMQWQSTTGITWIWALWPLGGSVRLLNTRIAPVPVEEHQRCFDKQPAWVRILILLAGIAANLLMAWFALLLVFTLGMKQRPPIIESIEDASLAYQTGLQAGDRLLSVDGSAIASWQQFGQSLLIAMGKSDRELIVKTAAGKVKRLRLDLQHWRVHPKDTSLLQSIGIHPDIKIKKEMVRASSFLQALQQATVSMWGLFVFFMVILERIVTGDIPFSLLLGPIGMLDATAFSFTQGVSVFAFFVASFSVAVAVINSLPIPGLDGGSLVYLLIEKIRGKPMSIALEVLLYRLTFIAFAVLLVQLLMNDLQRYLAA